MTKLEARDHCRGQWQAFLRAPQNSKLILTHLAYFLDQLRSATRFLMFIPLTDELDYLNVLQERDLCFYAPRTLAGKLEFRRYDPNPHAKYSQVQKGYLQIPGPSAQAPLLELPLTEEDYILLPALGLHYNGSRLGRGGGYYDRWCAGLGRPKCVALMPTVLCRLDFPLQSHDTCVGSAITETGILEYL